MNSLTYFLSGNPCLSDDGAVGLMGILGRVQRCFDSLNHECKGARRKKGEPSHTITRGNFQGVALISSSVRGSTAECSDHHPSRLCRSRDSIDLLGSPSKSYQNLCPQYLESILTLMLLFVRIISNGIKHVIALLLIEKLSIQLQSLLSTISTTTKAKLCTSTIHFVMRFSINIKDDQLTSLKLCLNIGFIFSRMQQFWSSQE